MIRDALLGAITAVAASVVYDPTILTVEFASGRRIEVPATTSEVCETARRALVSGLWRLDDEPKIAATSCRPGDGFEPASRYIRGYNMPAGLR